MIRFVFINNVFSATDSDIRELPREIIFSYDASMMRLEIPRNYTMQQPIHCLHINHNSQKKLVNLILRENSELSWMDEYQGNHSHYTTEVDFQIATEKNARLHYHKIQNECEEAQHLSETTIHLAQDSLVNMHLFSCGAKESRNNTTVKLNEKGARCALNGVYWLNTDNQQQDHFINVEHLAAHSESEMLFKGILNKKSRAAFTGKVLIPKNVQRIQAKQANHHLLLSQHAEACSKPELEIYSDDVKCAHGATTGQLDDAALFYLRSRGLEKSAAQTLLTAAFATDVFQQIQQKWFLQRIETLFSEKMGAI